MQLSDCDLSFIVSVVLFFLWNGESQNMLCTLKVGVYPDKKKKIVLFNAAGDCQSSCIR